MASCGYAKLVGGIFGSSADNPVNVHVVQLGSCNRNTKAHLKSYDVRDSTLDSEVKLLLARAGRLQQFLWGMLWRSAYAIYTTSVGA